MLNDILWDKSHCDGIALKPFLQVVSLISKLKVCLQRVYMRVCQPYLHSGCECCYTGIIRDFPLYLEPKKDFKNCNIYLIML